MSDDEIFRVVAVVLRVPVGDVNLESNMDNLANWDSLAHMNLILALEEEFGVRIPDEDAANMTSVRLIKVVLDELMCD